MTGGLCAKCHVELDPFDPQADNAFQVDHIVPKSQLGLDHLSNYQPLCAMCNKSKGNNEVIDFRPPEVRTQFPPPDVPVAEFRDDTAAQGTTIQLPFTLDDLALSVHTIQVREAVDLLRLDSADLRNSVPEAVEMILAIDSERSLQHFVEYFNVDGQTVSRMVRPLMTYANCMENNLWNVTYGYLKEQAFASTRRTRRSSWENFIGKIQNARSDAVVVFPTPHAVLSYPAGTWALLINTFEYEPEYREVWAGAFLEPELGEAIQLANNCTDNELNVFLTLYRAEPWTEQAKAWVNLVDSLEREKDGFTFSFEDYEQVYVEAGKADQIVGLIGALDLIVGNSV